MEVLRFAAGKEGVIVIMRGVGLRGCKIGFVSVASIVERRDRM
jgi:hypothetical protein